MIQKKHIGGEGIIYYRGKVSLTAVALNIVKKDQKLPNPGAYGRNIIKLKDALSKSKHKDELNESDDHSESRIYTSKDFGCDLNSAYKYMPTNILNNHLLKGQFQLGTIEYYRTVENERIRDIQEGFTTLLIETKDRQVYSSIIGGKNYYVYCMTEQGISESSMQTSFGQSLVKITSLRSFAKALAKALGAKNFHIYKINYSDSKIFSFIVPQYEVGDFEPTIFDDLFEEIEQNLFLSTLFIKPEGFKSENEIRIVFEMNKDLKKPKVINNKGLLDYIKVIK